MMYLTHKSKTLVRQGAKVLISARIEIYGETTPSSGEMCVLLLYFSCSRAGTSFPVMLCPKAVSVETAQEEVARECLKNLRGNH